MKLYFELLSSEIYKYIGSVMKKCHQNMDCDRSNEIELIIAFLEKHKTILAYEV